MIFFIRSLSLSYLVLIIKKVNFLYYSYLSGDPVDIESIKAGTGGECSSLSHAFQFLCVRAGG